MKVNFYDILGWLFLLLLSPLIICGGIARIIVFSVAIGFQVTENILIAFADKLSY